MIKLKRYLNRNTKRILLYIGIFILIIIIIQILNQIAKDKNNKNNNITIEYENKTNYEQRSTIISDEKVDKETNKNISNLISDFVEKCNDKKVEEAYNMLSSDCKNQMFPNIESFKNIYYNVIFKKSRQVQIQSWVTKDGIYTYKVRFLGNMLSTGGKSNENTEDYYSIIREEDGSQKLNINGFINKKNLNRENISNGIKIIVKSVYRYIDYEIYNVEIKNDNNYKILLDTKAKTNTMYVTDDNSNRYIAYNYELSDDDLIVNAKSNKQINIKFYKAYNSNINTIKMVFSDIVINYNQYNQSTNIVNDKRYSVEIDL